MQYNLNEEHRTLLERASAPSPAVIFGGVPMPSTQEMVNIAWQSIGRDLGFDWTTVANLDEEAGTFTANPIGGE